MDNNEKKLLKMRSLLETGKLLNSEMDIDTILDTLLSKSLKLIDGADMGVIFLHNEETNLLELYTSIGMGDAVKDVKLLPGESMTGLAFVNKEPMFFPDNESVQQAMSKMQEKNKKLAVAGNVIASDINGSICCPLIYKNKPIGVLVVDNLKSSNQLKEDDVDFLMDISTQATIAIINARNYKNELENNKKLKKYNKIIQHQNNRYKHSNYIHTTLTEMVLNGSSIDDILSKIKKLIKKDVFIIDPFYNISHSALEDNNQLKKITMKMPDLLTDLKNKQSEYVDLNNDSSFHIFPIVVNRDNMGWLCVLDENQGELSELNIITAERATTVIALELFKQNEMFNMEQSLKGDFLDSLLLNNDPDYINKFSQKYGFNIDASHRIIVIKINNTSDENKFDKEVNKLLKKYYKFVNEETKPIFSNPICLIKGNTIIIIFESNNSKNKEQIESFITSFQKRWASNSLTKLTKGKYKIGISESFSNIDEFKSAYFNSIQALKMINSRKDKNHAYYEDLAVKKFLMNNDPDELKAFADKILAPLKNYKNSSRTDFVKTLKVYLQTNCNWTQSKEILHIHGNTLTYRLNRINELLNINLDNYNDRIKLQIAYEINDLLSNWN